MRSRYPKFIIFDSGTGVGERVLARNGGAVTYRLANNWEHRELVDLANRALEMFSAQEEEAEKQKRREARARARKKAQP